MSILSAIILGIVEGITEFLPISSTGHLIIAGNLLGMPETELLKSFDIAIQLGAILAAAMLYGRILVQKKHVLCIVIVGFIPTGILGLLLHDVVKKYLFGMPTVISALFLGGIALILFEAWMLKRKPTIARVEHITFTQAIVIGLAQSLALIPGTSRSAMTIMGGMLLGIERTTIVEFSFLLAIPTMAAATGYDLIRSASTFSLHDAGIILLGFVCSFCTAILAMRWLMTFLRSHTFTGFGIYRIIVAMLLWNLMLR